MRILALDIATKTGFAFGVDAGLVDSGVVDFSVSRSESPGFRYIKMREWLRAAVLKHRPEVVFYEMPHMRGGSSTEVLVGLCTRVHEVCAELGIEYKSVHSATIKKFALGKGRGEKSEMIEAAKKRWPGVNIISDDHADSLLLLSHAFEAVV